MKLAILVKAKKAPIGSVSPSGRYRKIAEGKWIPIKNHTSEIVKQQLPEHVRALRIPPAWTDVQYNSNRKAELLVTGKDAKGRTQYIYSAKHVTKKAAEKFARINALNGRFGSIVAENAVHLREKKEEALVLALIMRTGIRPGSDKETGGAVQAYGATTLEGRHVIEEEGGTVRLQFIGKKGVELSVPVPDQRIARLLLKRKAEVGSGRLFSITANRLLRYMESLSNGARFRTKDLRTYLATETAIAAMNSMALPTSMSSYKKSVRAVAETVAAKLGNTPTVALQRYINPAVFTKWKARL